MNADLELALDHRFAQVAARALTAVAQSEGFPLREQILLKANAKESPVRKALVALLRSTLHPTSLPALCVLAGDTWSADSRYSIDECEYPIAQEAVAAIAELDKIDDIAADQLYGVALGTSDSTLRSEIFKILAMRAGIDFQERLFELAVGRGRIPVRTDASQAMLLSHDTLAEKIIASITAEVLNSVRAEIAVHLTIIFASRAEPESILRSAEELGINKKRRGLLVLMILLTKSRDSEIARKIAKILPQTHPAVEWAFDDEFSLINDHMLEDVSEPAIAEEMLGYLNAIKRSYFGSIE